jgi:hypothetical protein
MSTQPNTSAPRAEIPPELDALIERVARHQNNLRLSDARFVARYSRHLKSVDSWVRTLKNREADRLTSRNYAKWAKTLAALIAEIEDAAGGEQVFNLPILAEAIQLFERLQGARGDIRVGWLIGTTGVGKSVALRYLSKQNDRTSAYLIVPELWRDNKTALCNGLASAVGVASGKSANETFEAVVARLNVTPQTLLVDEFHEGGVLLVKLVKTLIERTPTRFLLTTWPSGFSRLVSGFEGLGETRQLVGRSLRPICRDWQHGTRAADIAAYLSSVAWGDSPLAKEDIKDLARDFAPAMRRWGFRHLTQAVEQAQTRADARDEPLTADALRAAFGALGEDVLG